MSLLLRFRHFHWTPNRVWLGIFAFWLFLLSGITHEIGAGSPGILQYLRLSHLLAERHAQALNTEAEIGRLEGEAAALMGSRTTQEREIRKTMGYVGENEMIFDFSFSQSAPLRR